MLFNFFNLEKIKLTVYSKNKLLLLKLHLANQFHKNEDLLFTLSTYS